MTSLKRLFLTLALTSMWSPSFLFIKLAISDLPPMTVVAARVTLSALIFAGILFYLRRALPTDFTFWKHSMVMAIFSSALPFCLFCYAEGSIESALAAILNGTSPMYTALLAHLFVASDQMNARKALGITVSFCGLLLLVAPDINNGLLSGTSIGIATAIAGTFCYSISHVYGKLFITGQRPFIAPAAQLISSAMIMLPLALWYDAPWNLSIPSFEAIGGVMGLTIWGTVIAFVVYYKMLEECGPTAISMVACFFPAGGMLLGYLFLDETLPAQGLMASGLILLGMMIVNNVIPLPFFKTAEAKQTA